MPSRPGENSRKTPDDDFARLADQASTGLLGEFWGFLRHNKKWWLLPILAVLVLLGLLVVLSSPAVAPFIYTLF
jgi:hypothetical protein